MRNQDQEHSGWRANLGRARVVLLAGAAAVLVACGSGGGAGGSMGSTSSSSTASASTGQSCSNCGPALVTMTDTAGTFQTYLVTIDSLQLTRTDGTVIETLPVATQVDFAQLVDVSELVSTALLPFGRYDTVSMKLDYSAAQIVLAGASTPVPLGDIYLGSSMTSVAGGNSTLTVTLELDSNHPFIISPGQLLNLALDFNLDTSNVVSTAGGVSTVTVDPVLTGSLVPDQTKQVHVRGPLVSVAAPAADGSGSYVINVRPFNRTQGDNGQFTVATAATTTFTINGVTSTGGAGLSALSAALAAAGSTPLIVAAYGNLDTATLSFTASSVVAGFSVIGSIHDGLDGSVVAVTAGAAANTNVAAVLGALMMQPLQPGVRFAPLASVTVRANTAVSELGHSGTFTYTSISVGQHAQFAGNFAADTLGNPLLDATAGAANLLPTLIYGTISSLGSGVVTMSPQLLDGLPVAFVGFVTPFGAAAGTSPPDFNATALASFANTAALLTLNWAPPGDSTLTDFTVSASGLSIDQPALNASSNDQLRVGYQNVSLSGLTSGLQIVPDTAPTSPVFFAIAHANTWMIGSYEVWGDFSTALAAALSGSGGSPTVQRIFARGPYSAMTGTLSAGQVVVILGD